MCITAVLFAISVWLYRPDHPLRRNASTNEDVLSVRPVNGRLGEPEQLSLSVTISLRCEIPFMIQVSCDSSWVVSAVKSPGVEHRGIHMEPGESI